MLAFQRESEHAMLPRRKKRQRLSRRCHRQCALDCPFCAAAAAAAAMLERAAAAVCPLLPMPGRCRRRSFFLTRLVAARFCRGKSLAFAPSGGDVEALLMLVLESTVVLL